MILEWFRAFFDEWHQMGLAGFAGMTLDVSHARALSVMKSDLNAWLALTVELRNQGFPLHFHIHANDGSRDQHVALSHAEGLLGPSSWAPQGLLNWLKSAMAQHPHAQFTLENKADHALEALAFVRERLLGEIALLTK